MPSLATPVAKRATDAQPTRAARARGTSRHLRSVNTETARHAEVFHGLEPLFTNTREAAVVGNMDSGEIVLWNPAAERLLGWSAADVVGRPIASLISPAIVPLHRAILAIQRDRGAAEPGRPLDLVITRADRTQVHVELTLAPIRGQVAAGHYVLILLHADSELRQQQLHTRALADLQSQLDTARQRLSVLEAGVAELARDVRRARRSVQHVQRRANMPELGRVTLSARIAARRVQHLARNVDALRGQAPHDLETQRINLVPIVNRVVARLRSDCPRHRFNTAVPQGLTATVDPRRFEDVIEILLEDAIARCRGGCWIDVDLRRPLVGQARLEVRDFGQPVSNEDRDRLASGGHDDRALARAHAIVEAHGGSLQFEFPPDGGVRAVVLLPTQRGRGLATG